MTRRGVRSLLQDVSQGKRRPTAQRFSSTGHHWLSISDVPFPVPPFPFLGFDPSFSA
jgi:hypothetical protein